MPVSIPVGAELDERSATAAAEKARRVFAAAGQDAGRAFGAGLGQADEGLRKFEKQAKDTYDKAADAAGKLRSEEEKLQSLRDRGARNDQIVSQAERVEKARRAEVRAIRDATDAYRDYQAAAEGASRGSGGFATGLVAGFGDAGRSAGDSFSGGLGAGLSAARVAGIGATAGAAIGAGFVTAGIAAGRLFISAVQDGMATLQLRDQFQAAMGLDEVSMTRYANAAGQAFANHFGSSLADNLGAARAALQSGLVAPGSSDSEVQGVIQTLQGASATSLGAATPEELSRTATTLIRTGMAADVSSAMDIVTAGFQDGLNVSQDWLDTLNEYPTQFRKLGLDAGQFMTLLKQGLEGGARDTDKVADSLKEFSIRAVDGSKSTKEGFEALGFNAEEMGRRFAEGGDSARVAFGAVLEKLRETKDPQEQALIWQRLFGTQWEDMGDAVKNFSLDPVKNQFKDLSGVSENATKTATDNFKSEWETATRTVGQFFSDLKTDIAEWFTDLPVIRDLPGMITYAFGGGDRPTRNGPGIVGPTLPGGSATDLLLPPSGNGATAPLQPPGGNGLPGPLGLLPADGAPLPGTPAAAPPQAGPRTPIPGVDAGGAKAKPSFDPSQYSVDAIPVAGAPGPLPVAGTPGVPMWGTGNDPFGKPGYGMYQVDPQRVYDAETSVLSARTSVENARIRVLELEAEGTATAQDLAQARNSVTMAERQYTSAQMKLAEAQQGTWKKMEGAAKSFGQGMDQIGAALDSDLGISKGLPGLAENLVKFVGSLAAAPLEAQLAAISKYNPIQGGHGLLGILGAQGVFGPQYTQSQYGQQGYGPSGMGPAMLRPGSGGGQPYGLPGGTDTGGYGSSGAVFPPWVHALEQAFGVKASTYSGHQEGDRHEAGYAPNPNHENRGIDWSGPVDAMQRFADYLSQVPGALEQVIWKNPNTGATTEIAGGRPQPGYFAGDLAGHQNHVHTRQSASIPLPGGGPGPQWSADWNAIAQKESSGNWGINTGNGYQGGLQFSPSSWQLAGGTQYAPSADQASPYEQALTAEQLLALQGPGAWPNTFTPGSSGPMPAFGGGGGPMAGGMPQAAPFARTPGVGGITPPAMPGGGGPGLSGDGAIGMAMQAGGLALDAMAPGAGQAAQIGMKLANRAIQFGGQAAGIGVSGLMETFLPSGSPLGNLGNSWFGKLASGFASARPALPNVAAQQAPANPNAQGQGQSGQPQPGQPVTVNYTNNQATEDRAGADIARHLEATNSPAGKR